MGRMIGPGEVRKAKEPTKAMRKLLPYFAPFKWRMAVLAVLLIVGTLSELAAPFLIGVAVDQFIDPASSAPLPELLGRLVGAEGDRLAGLGRTMALLAGAYLFSWGMSVAQFRLMVRVAQQVLLTMRTQIFQTVQALSVSYFDRHEAGDLMSRLINDTQTVNDVFGPGVTRLVRMALGMTGIVISMVALNWRLALVSFSVLPIVLGATILFTRRAREAFRRTRKTVGEVSAELQENISGVREVQAFARESETASEFRDVNARNREANVGAETLMAVFVPVLEVLSVVALALVAGYGGYLALAYSPPLVSIGIIVTFITYVRRFYEPIRELSALLGEVQSAIAGAERIFELIESPPEVVDAPDAVTLPPAEGRIEFDDVSFAYTETEQVLDHVSFTIEPGQMYAIVGHTGAGKTTLVNLLMRFYDAKGGAVRIDGHDVREVTQASLRRQMGIVLQDNFLFSTSVMRNIRYGRPDATDEEVMEAARIANAHDFVTRLPQGYETEVGERGANLSQGHRQLLAIARAILEDPRILILDEATSSVDTRTERLIQRALERLLAGRSSLVIAHRLSTIRRADQILLIDKGVIVERGRHEELMALQGAYYDLYMSQFRREQEQAPVPVGTPEPSVDGATSPPTPAPRPAGAPS